MQLNDIVDGITALGLGSGLGAILTAFITSRAQKGKARAEAADLIMNAAERVGKMNELQDAEIRLLRSEVEEINSSITKYLDGVVGKEELLELLRRTRLRDWH